MDLTILPNQPSSQNVFKKSGSWTGAKNWLDRTNLLPRIERHMTLWFLPQREGERKTRPQHRVQEGKSEQYMQLSFQTEGSQSVRFSLRFLAVHIPQARGSRLFGRCRRIGGATLLQAGSVDLQASLLATLRILSKLYSRSSTIIESMLASSIVPKDFHLTQSHAKSIIDT